MKGAAALLAVAVLVLAGCGGKSEPNPQGGAQGLPGPLPAGAKIAPEDTKAPHAGDFDLTLLDGKQVKASELWAKRPLVVTFLTSWCARCAANQKLLNGLAHRYEDLVPFVAVASQDTPAALRTYLADHDVPYAAGIDGKGTIWRQYAVQEPPVTVVIGKGGRLLRGWTVDVPEATLDAELAKLAARK